MKRISILLVAILTALITMAQTEHLKFMGIPLNGTINTFQNKLLSKGMRLDSELNRQLPAGSRSFSGVFSGETANIYVYYSPASKIVYRTKAVIDYIDEETAKRKLNEFKAMLREKYQNCYISDGEQNGFPSVFFIIYDSDFNTLGSISLYITTYELPQYKHFLHIDYEDKNNTALHERSRLDDL